MPQFQPQNYMDPNPTYRYYNGEIYLFTPTKTQDWSWGASGVGGTVRKLTPEEVQQNRLNRNNTYEAVISPDQWVKNGGFTDNDVLNKIKESFKSMDPSNSTGWEGYVERNKTDLIKRGQEIVSRDPMQLTNFGGQAWNEFRYDPKNATAIQQLQAQNNPARPEFSSQSDALDYAAGQSGSSGSTPPAGSTGGSGSAPAVPSPITAGQINFKTGLSEQQKTSIVNLMNRTTPMNETDARNYAFATGTNWQDYVGKTPQQILGISSSSQQGTGSSLVPDSIKNSPAYQGLSADQKSLIDLAYQASNASSAEEKDRLNKALQEAIKVVDPMMKEQIRLVQDELSRNVGSTEADSKSAIERSTERIRQIKEDLAYNKEQLSLDQQAELSSQLREHENKLYETQQSMAESGLAFSSPRSRAESLLKSEYQDMTESTQRKYNRANRTNEVASARDVAELERNVQDLQRGKGEKLTGLARGAEATLGSGNLPAVPGVSPLGGVTGTLEQQRQRLLAGLESDLSNDYLKPYLS